MTDDTDSSDELEEWTVPVIDPDTGDGHDVTVEARDATQAMARAPDGYHVSRTFVEKHTDFDLPSPGDIEVNDE